MKRAEIAAIVRRQYEGVDLSLPLSVLADPRYATELVRQSIQQFEERR